jgi:hypothetical protein
MFKVGKMPIFGKNSKNKSLIFSWFLLMLHSISVVYQLDACIWLITINNKKVRIQIGLPMASKSY